MKTIRTTESVCPHCLISLPATVYEKDKEVWMAKSCPEHGRFDVYLWPDVERYEWFCGYAFPGLSRAPQTGTVEGCPHDCGLCPGHARGITLPEIEVTWRCNLACPVCFMSDRHVPSDPSLDDIRRMVETIRSFDGPCFPLQITGGEPTIRADLPEIVEMAAMQGASAVELNTNGLVIGRDIEYLRSLKKAGLTNVYLQFDGLLPSTTRVLRGRDVLVTKLQAIENCRIEKIPVILSVTIVEGVNEMELGRIIRYAMDNLDVIRGLALQPAFVSGRFELGSRKHLSVGDVARLISEQTGGGIKATDFWPVGSSHPLCYGSTYLLPENGGYIPFTRHLKEEDYRQNFSSSSPQGAFFMDIVAGGSPSKTPPQGLPILIMEYMDAWTMDLERTRECNLAVTLPDGSSIPFCVYHLTDSRGERLYPHGGRRRHAARA
jgi:7,8-dihydro-6-hydroxymethylpterin dimethyltransferase